MPHPWPTHVAAVFSSRSYSDSTSTTGKTNLIKLAVNSIDEPMGVVYVDIPRDSDLEVTVAKAMQKALGWSPDQLIDSSEPASLEEGLQVLSRHAIKYKQEYKRVPVLIIDNVNRLAQMQPRLLDLFQDYAKDTADNRIVTVVFLSSEGRVPRRLMGKLIMYIVLLIIMY
jgi:hypothetical protein